METTSNCGNVPKGTGLNICENIFTQKVTGYVLTPHFNWIMSEKIRRYWLEKSMCKFKFKADDEIKKYVDNIISRNPYIDDRKSHDKEGREAVFIKPVDLIKIE